MTLADIKTRLLKELNQFGLNNTNIEFIIIDAINMIINAVRNTETSVLSSEEELTGVSYNKDESSVSFTMGGLYKPHRVVVLKMNGNTINDPIQLVNVRTREELYYVEKPSYYKEISGTSFKIYTNFEVSNEDWKIKSYYLLDSLPDTFEFNNINAEQTIINFVKARFDQSGVANEIFNTHFYQFCSECSNTHVQIIPTNKSGGSYNPLDEMR